VKPTRASSPETILRDYETILRDYCFGREAAVRWKQRFADLSLSSPAHRGSPAVSLANRVAQLIAISATERGLALVTLLPLTYLAVRGIGRFRQIWAEPMDTREYRGWLNSPSLFPEWDERAT
jgi:hypothetical protein